MVINTYLVVQGLISDAVSIFVTAIYNIILHSSFEIFLHFFLTLKMFMCGQTNHIKIVYFTCGWVVVIAIALLILDREYKVLSRKSINNEQYYTVFNWHSINSISCHSLPSDF